MTFSLEGLIICGNYVSKIAHTSMHPCVPNWLPLSASSSITSVLFSRDCWTPKKRNIINFWPQNMVRRHMQIVTTLQAMFWFWGVIELEAFRMGFRCHCKEEPENLFHLFIFLWGAGYYTILWLRNVKRSQVPKTRVDSSVNIYWQYCTGIGLWSEESDDCKHWASVFRRLAKGSSAGTRLRWFSGERVSMWIEWWTTGGQHVWLKFQLA